MTWTLGVHSLQYKGKYSRLDANHGKISFSYEKIPTYSHLIESSFKLAVGYRIDLEHVVDL